MAKPADEVNMAEGSSYKNSSFRRWSCACCDPQPCSFVIVHCYTRKSVLL